MDTSVYTQEIFIPSIPSLRDAIFTAQMGGLDKTGHLLLTNAVNLIVDS